MIDDPIRRYRDDVAAAGLARGDVDEIEDHLRALAEDLQGTGMSRTDAISEACQRLGAPRALAREYARVRPAFGVTLSRSRAWSAAALLAWWWFEFARVTLAGPGLASTFGVNLVIATIALGGLIARATWARAIIAGALSWFVVGQAIELAWHGLPAAPLLLGTACKAGAFLFVVPWRRRELAPAGYAIVLLAWAFHGVNVIAMHQLTGPDQLPLVAPGLGLAFIGTLVAGVGVLVRARWAAFAAFAAAAGLALGYADLRTLALRFPDAALVQVQIFGAISAGAAAAVLAGVVAWRAARATLGTLAGLRS